MGYDFKEELKYYGERISDLHIKDRELEGGSVFLGTGDVNLLCFLREIEKYDFEGPVIFQLFRDDEGIAIFKVQSSICALETAVGKNKE